MNGRHAPHGRNFSHYHQPQPHVAVKHPVTKPHWCASWSWHRTLVLFAVLMAILTLIVVIFSVVFSAAQNSTQRFCIEPAPERVDPGPGEAGAGPTRMQFTLDSNGNQITFRFRYSAGTLSNVQAIHVRGPIPIGSNTGNIKFPLCGVPSTTVCDTITTPGEVKGTLVQIEPGGTDPRPEILNIRADPDLYYIEVLTSANPATPGALRAPLTSICGTP